MGGGCRTTEGMEQVAQLSGRVFREWGILGCSGLKSDAQGCCQQFLPITRCCPAGMNLGLLLPPAQHPSGVSASPLGDGSTQPQLHSQTVLPFRLVSPSIPSPAQPQDPAATARCPLLAGSPRLTQEVRQDDRNNPPGLQHSGFRSMYLYGLQNAVGA